MRNLDIVKHRLMWICSMAQVNIKMKKPRVPVARSIWVYVSLKLPRPKHRFGYQDSGVSGFPLTRCQSCCNRVPRTPKNTQEQEVSQGAMSWKKHEFRSWSGLHLVTMGLNWAETGITRSGVSKAKSLSVSEHQEASQKMKDSKVLKRFSDKRLLRHVPNQTSHRKRPQEIA
jgi:hypothetical protein